MMVRALSATAILTLITWAFWPLPRTEVQPAREPTGPATPQRAALELDRAAFATPIWVEAPAPPPPPAPEPKPAAPTPPKIQFLGIASEDGERCALVFDESADRIATLRLGDLIAGCTITGITTTRLEVLSDQGSAFSFELKRPEGKR